MTHPHYIILYVDSPLLSAEFYSNLLGIEPVEVQNTFALFVLNNGIKFGLWSKHTVEPASTMTGGGAEIGFSLENKKMVDEWSSAWKSKGLTIIQSPTEMDFGYTFTATDLDGHRLRVFALNE
jgi:predicted lactoylglutathione lyase